MHPRLLAVFAGAATLAGAGCATAGAAGWSVPAPLPGSDGRFALFASFGTGQAPAIGVLGPLRMFPGTPQVPIAVAPDPSAAPIGLPHGLTAPLALSPGGTMLAVGGPRSPLDYFTLEGRRARVHVGIGPVGGTLALVGTGGLVATKTLAAAVDDRGEAAVILSRCSTKGCSRRELLAIFRARGGRFGRALRLDVTRSVPVASVAIGPTGHVLLAWTVAEGPGRQTVRVRMRRSDGRLTRTRSAGTTLPRPTLALAVTPKGAGSVAWLSQSHGVGRPYTARSRVIDSRGTLHGVDSLDSGGGTPLGGVPLRAVGGPDGSVTYAWTGIADGHRVVRGLRLHRDVGQSFAISPPGADAQLADLQTDAAGDVLALFRTRPPSTAPTVSATILRVGGAAFDPPQVVLTGTGATGTVASAIASASRAVVAGGAGVAIDPDGPAVQVTQLG